MARRAERGARIFLFTKRRRQAFDSGPPIYLKVWIREKRQFIHSMRTVGDRLPVMETSIDFSNWKKFHQRCYFCNQLINMQKILFKQADLETGVNTIENMTKPIYILRLFLH